MHLEFSHPFNDGRSESNARADSFLLSGWVMLSMRSTHISIMLPRIWSNCNGKQLHKCDRSWSKWCIFIFPCLSTSPPPLKSLIDCASRPWTTVTIVSLKLQMYLVHRQRAQIRNTELLSFHTRILAHVSHVNLLLKKTFTGGRDLSFSVYTWRKLLNSSSRHSKTLVAKEPQ